MDMHIDISINGYAYIINIFIIVVYSYTDTP